jgi:oligopeptide transport system permease protein
MGVVILYGVLIILFNFLVDLVYAWLDPRIRYDEQEA